MKFPSFVSPALRQCMGALLPWLLVMCLGGLLPTARAFPPAPHHLFYGMVRDEYGTPITDPKAVVFLVTSSGVQFQTTIVPGLEPGINYRLAVPMDAGISSDLYKPTALRPTTPFRIKVVIGKTTYLPMEMAGDLSQMGQPGKRTLMNLTLGEDSNGDGLPDAWQRMINSDLSKVAPDGDADGDGMTNLQEYLAGTYAFDSKDGFMLEITGVKEEKPMLRFVAIRGRNYVVTGSTDLKNWAPVGFRIPSVDTPATVRASYGSTDTRTLDVQVQPWSDQSIPSFFKLILQ